MLPLKPILYGLIAALLLLGFYFLMLNFVSGWSFTLEQFRNNWYYIILLSFGFGIQIALYTYLKNIVHNRGGGKMVAVSGTTSTAAMISCCSHYLVNILPIIGITGLVTFVSQYQIQLFWLGIAANLAGILYISSKIKNLKK
ncbi:MAG: hypothetical protein M1426_02785 [Patescibacteria group bacterium]|nr:hypothetical protein [Patescibacteria group bacterium]